MRITRTFCGLFVLALAAIFTISVSADTIKLKDGGLIKGKIVSFSGGKFVVAIGEGSRRRQLSFNSDEVASIQFDEPAAAPERYARNNTPVRRDPPVINVNAGTRVTSPVQKPDDADAEPVETVETREVQQPQVKTSAPAKSPERTGSTAVMADPIAVSVKVLADETSNGWTNSGWVVRKGQKIKITGDGRISLGKGQFSTPSGVPEINDDQKLLKGVATGALIAVIGDDNNDFMYIGAQREFTAKRDGTLFLGVNEGNLKDNSGTYDVKVEIAPEAK
jgi:hypothetical protein